MESLALIVAILFFLAIFCGPIAILITKIKTHSLVTLFFKRIFHGVFITLGTLVGAQWLLVPGLPIAPRLFGITSLGTCYIATRNEYFPTFKILSRLGIKTGRSDGKDGHGPEGQH
ncbi:MAG: hypothetical protein EBW17_01205 [Actinobacteria bacterium]|jgi:hypothetical protein|nr:hypothetical protein [Actinomycetota bacterium]